MALCCIICILFAGSKLIAIQQRYDKAFEINPYDEIITFPMTLLAIGFIIFLYQKELQKQEKVKTKLIKDLEDKNKETSRIYKELNPFTYIASHDLKTPLRTISSHLDLIQLHIKRQEFSAVDTDIQFAKLGATQLYTLINDILEYKKINQSSKTYEVIDLNELVAEIKQSLGLLLEVKNGSFTHDKLPLLFVDRHEFLTLFQNLLENAIKYNEVDQAQVHIRFRHEEQQLIFDFIDNGIGIDQEYHEMIFQFFKRLHTSNTYEGTGIGLGLCKKIASNYRGKISVHSSSAEGSTFRLTIGEEHLRTALLEVG